LEWLPNYNREWLRPDLIAALTVWALLVPEAMAYASLAGLPPEAGLYAAPLALLGYGIFGTSRPLVVGPSSTVAAMSLVVVGAFAIPGSADFIALSATLAVLVGILFVVAGLLKLGFLADFMSRPVLSGLVVGIAISIAAGQLDKLLGYSVPEAGFFREILLFVQGLDMISLPTLVVSVIALALLFGLEAFIPRIPAALVVVVLGIVLSAVLDLEELGVHVVGEIPSGLPPFGLQGVALGDILRLLPGALGILLVAFAESVAAARNYATKHGYAIEADQEMIGLGVANLGAGFSQGFVVDGSLSRTAAADQAGQKSQLASIVNAGLILVTAAFLTPLFRTLPEAVLGAIVVHAVWHLISFKELERLYRIRRQDFWAGLVALIGVLLFGILAGLILAVTLSFLGLLARASRPSTAVLGRVTHAGGDVFANIALYPDSETYPGLVIFRFDQQIFFANAPMLREAVREAVRTADPPAKVVLFDAEDIPDIDTTAMDTITELYDELARADIELWFSRVRAEVMVYLRRAELDRTIGPDQFYLSVRAGVDAYLERFS